MKGGGEAVKIGCCTTIEHCRDAALAGFDYIELPGKVLAGISSEELERWVQVLHRENMPCMGLYAAIDPSVKICGPHFSRAHVQRYAALLCARASCLGVKKIGVGSPASREVPEGYDLELAWQQTKEFLRILCEHAAPHGIEILWEPVNQFESRFGVDSLESMQHISALAEEGIENVGLVCDLYHVVIKQEDAGVVQKLAPYIRHLHIASASDGQRGFLTGEDAAGMRPLVRLCRGLSGTISAEPASGQVLTDGKRCIDILHCWLSESNEAPDRS